MLRLAPLALASLLWAPTANALPAADAEAAAEEAAPAITAAPEVDAVLLAARTALGTTDAWVSVDDEGRPAATLSPFYTTDDEGSTYLRDAAPHDLTATVFTYTSYGKVSTSTGDPPNPTATNKAKEGGFPVCKNMEGDHAPICAPAADSTLYKDSIYYVTWDPEFFNKTYDNLPSNATVEVSLRLDYFNRTFENSDEGETLKLDETDRVPASWGLFALEIKGSHLKGHRPHEVTITLMTNIQGSGAKNESTSIDVILDKHRLPEPELSAGPEHEDLIIALPVVFGVVVLIALGLCLWNRKTRRIQLGNIISRSPRHGYTGRSQRALALLNRSHRKNDVTAAGIPLESRDPPTPEYRDDYEVPPGYGRTGQRRDSDLGSLTGSPTSPAFGQQAGGRDNAFREEMRRQDEARRNERGPY